MHSHEHIYICPQILVATHLTCSASAVLMARSLTKHDYFIVGKENGDVIFFAGDRTHISTHRSEAKSPITAITSGKFMQSAFDEVIAISADGCLRSIEFPQWIDEKCILPPCLLFDILLHANICAAKLLDVDGDGINELFVATTDRIVHTYRYMEDRLQPINKWDVPTEIQGIALGRTPNGQIYALLTQTMLNYAVRIDFSVNNCATVPLPVAVDRKCCIEVPVEPIFLSLVFTLHSMLYVVSADRINEIELENIGGHIVSAAVQVLKNRVRLAITCDTRGNLSIYAWKDDQVSVMSKGFCRVLFEVDHIAANETNEENVILVGVSTLHRTVAIYRISLTPILREL